MSGSYRIQILLLGLNDSNTPIKADLNIWIDNEANSTEQVEQEIVDKVVEASKSYEAETYEELLEDMDYLAVSDETDNDNEDDW